jgi:hypothetical protein
VELRLAREAECGAGRKPKWETVNPDYVVDAGALRGLEFLLNVIGRAVIRREEVTVEPREVTIDVFFAGEAIDARNRGLVTLYVQAQGVRAVKTLNFVKTVVDHVGEVSGCARCLAASDICTFENRYFATLAGEEVRGCEPGDPRTDHAHIGC